MAQLSDELASPVRCRRGAPPKLRADAARNRAKVLEVAAEVFTELGVDAPLEEVARRAGVGIGTLYRHFPTREALVFGVYRDQIEFLHARSLELAASQSPAAALHAWMRSFVAYAAVKRGMIALLKSMMQTDGDACSRTPGNWSIRLPQLLLDNAVAAGTIRTGIGAPELLRALGGICMADRRARGGRHGRRPGRHRVRRPAFRRGRIAADLSRRIRPGVGYAEAVRARLRTTTLIPL